MQHQEAAGVTLGRFDAPGLLQGLGRLIAQQPKQPGVLLGEHLPGFIRVDGQDTQGAVAQPHRAAECGDHVLVLARCRGAVPPTIAIDDDRLAAAEGFTSSPPRGWSGCSG